MYSLVDSHSVTEVTSLVSHKLPLEICASFQVAQAVARGIMDTMLNVDHLHPVVFMTSQNKAV